MDAQTYSVYDSEDYELQLTGRIMNLVWTVSGDYTTHYAPDTELFKRSQAMCLYDAIKQGAFAKYFDRDSLALYILKKVYLGADYDMLNSVAQMAVEASCRSRIEDERAGIRLIRKQALDEILEYDFEALNRTLAGRMKLQLIKSYVSGVNSAPKSMREPVEMIRELENATDTQTILRTIDSVYNRYLDKRFEKEHGSFEDVMNVPVSALQDNDWSDFLKDELYQDDLQKVLDEIPNAVTNYSSSGEGKTTRAKGGVTYLNNADIQKMLSSVENTFGKSCLSPAETRRLTGKLCRGIHDESRLHFTRGILATLPKEHYRYKYAQSVLSKNRLTYYDNHRVVKRNIAVMKDILKNSLVMRTENENIPSRSGTVDINKLWKIGRVETDRLFHKVIKRDEKDFVVDILIDSSGSQQSRQGKVALQAYILAEALSEVGIPHRIMGYNTFWTYTVLRIFRDYDSPRSENSSIFEYLASSNNRDGLAIKAAVDGLMERQEQHKVLIVLSDGRPNDQHVNESRPMGGIMYTGEVGVKDTAREVRAARMNNIAVLGVFAGKEEDLAAEKLIFGKDFAYIKNIANFSNIVGMYLIKQIEED